jgi:hypothetical protein
MSYDCGDQKADMEEFDLMRLAYNDKGENINPRIGIIAKSGSGKSYVIKAIMYFLWKTGLYCGTVIAPTDKMNKFYEEFVPEAFIYHEYVDGIIARFMNRQRKIIDKNTERRKHGKKEVDPRAYLIMDDCMSSKGIWLKDPLILSIFNEGRHFQIAPFILSMQYSIGIGPELRNNFDFVFLLGEDTFSSRRKLYEHYAGIFPTFDLFNQVFSQVTDNYGCMVLDNRLRSADIKKKVFWFKAKVPPTFKLANKYVMKFNKDNFDEDHDKHTHDIDLTTFTGNKRRQIIRVNKIGTNGK